MNLIKKTNFSWKPSKGIERTVLNILITPCVKIVV